MACAAARALPSTMADFPRVVENTEAQSLVEMGYSPDQVAQALRRCDQDVNRARAARDARLRADRRDACARACATPIPQPPARPRGVAAAATRLDRRRVAAAAASPRPRHG